MRRKTSSRIVGCMGVKRSSHWNIQMFPNFQMAFLNVDLSGIPVFRHRGYLHHHFMPYNMAWSGEIHFYVYPVLAFVIRYNLEPSFGSQPYCTTEMVKVVVVVISQNLHPLKMWLWTLTVVGCAGPHQPQPSKSLMKPRAAGHSSIGPQTNLLN